MNEKPPFIEVQATQKKIFGLSVRTTNADEMNLQTAKIGTLHQQFDERVEVDYKEGSRVYGAYYYYESDASGPFSVFAGTDKVKASTTALEELILPAGKYLVFKGNGDMPQAVIDTWIVIWQFFSKEQSLYQRTFNVDYEFYNSPNDVEIYIGVL